jgi:hypothetical protein
MKLTRWIVLLHLIVLAVACGVAMKTDRVSTRMMAFGLWQMIMGWVMIVSASVFLAWLAIKNKMRLRDVVMLVILILMGISFRSSGTQEVNDVLQLPPAGDEEGDAQVQQAKATDRFAIRNEYDAILGAHKHMGADLMLKTHRGYHAWSADRNEDNWEVNAFDTCNWHEAGYMHITIDGRDGEVISVVSMTLN